MATEDVKTESSSGSAPAASAEASPAAPSIEPLPVEVARADPAATSTTTITASPGDTSTVPPTTGVASAASPSDVAIAASASDALVSAAPSDALISASPSGAPGVPVAPTAPPVDWTRRQVRWLSRLLIVLLVLSGLVLVGLRLNKPIDLAAGKPWRVSSKWTECDPNIGRCGGSITLALFHTNDDDSPWFEIDLQRPTTFSGVTVVNRSDWMPERAVPLLVEVSDDQTNWKELARRDEVFLRWTTRFQPVTNRFIRVRVPRKTYLHLEGVQVHP